MMRKSRNLADLHLHDLSVCGEDEYEAVEGLEEMGSELLEDLGASRQRGLHAPSVAQAWKEVHGADERFLHFEVE